MKNFLAIEIGGSKLQIFTGDERANILERRRFTVDATDGGAGIRRQIAAALQEILPELKPAAIGVGFGGPVEGRTGQVCCSHQVAGWHNFALGGWLHELTALPVFLENDSNAAALAEAARGAGHGHNPVFTSTSAAASAADWWWTEKFITARNRARRSSATCA